MEEKKCPECSKIITEGSDICPSCGAGMATDGGESPTNENMPSPANADRQEPPVQKENLPDSGLGGFGSKPLEDITRILLFIGAILFIFVPWMNFLIGIILSLTENVENRNTGKILVILGVVGYAAVGLLFCAYIAFIFFMMAKTIPGHSLFPFIGF